MPPQQSSSGNRYDFIMNSSQKKPLIPSLGGQSSFTKKLIMIIGGAVILIIVMWVIGSLLGGGGSSAGITKLIQQEEEIARVATVAEEGTTRSDIKGIAKNIQLSLSSQQQEWLQFLAERGTQVSKEQQLLLQNPATDQQLTTAKSNNTFDKTFLDIMRTYLTDYSNALQTTFTGSKNEAERTLLRAHFDQTQLLLEQLPKN